MNRRRFLKYAGATAAVVSASALGFTYLGRPVRSSLNQTMTAALSTSETIATASGNTKSIPLNMPRTPTRLLASVEDFQRIWQLIQSNTLAARYYAALHDDGDWVFRQPLYHYHLCPPSECHDSAPVILSISRGMVKRIYTLGLLFRLTGEQRYLDRAWEELKAAASFPDWNPQNQFLDTAEMIHAFAIGYDWCPWTTEQRQVLRDAIVKNGLNPAVECYEGKTDFPSWWVAADHNWNQVCNGGVGMGALALLPDFPDLCKKIIGYAVKSLPTAMKWFAPDGGWPEGPIYWGYATLYNCIFLASLQTALQTDYGLSQLSGFSETGYFPIYITGPTQNTFNFADAEAEGVDSPQMFWLARRFSRGVYAWFSRTLNSTNYDNLDCSGPCIGRPLGLLWFDDQGGDPPSESLATSRSFSGVEVASLRTSWSDPDAMFVGFKAGRNAANHGHLDIGTFVLDALGVRWAIDLGPDDYSLPGYFDTKRQRWTYYRMRAEGHNTLVVNPSNGPDQDLRAAAKITRFKTEPEKSLAIADLAPAYPSYILKSERGLALLDRSSVIVQDEVTTNQPIDLWWFMHTFANVQLGEDKHEAMLDRRAARLWCTTVSPSEASFSVMDAKPLESSPNPTGQDQNLGIRKLAIHLKGVTSTRLSVVMVPLAVGQEPPTQMPAVVPLSEW